MKKDTRKSKSYVWLVMNECKARGRRDELKRMNRKFPDLCKSDKSELNYEIEAVKVAIKNVARKEESLQNHIQKRECKQDNLNISLKPTQRDYDTLRQRPWPTYNNSNDNNNSIIEN